MYSDDTNKKEKYEAAPRIVSGNTAAGHVRF